jgi:DNA-binding NarL/FixJ family response regulator
MSTEIKILIADDHPVVRQGLCRIIELSPDLRIVAEVGNGQDALEKVQLLQPDIAILDIDMPGQDGFKVAAAIGELKLPIEIIFLTVHREESFLNKAIDRGAKGYVLKDSAVTDIVTGIRTVIAGQHYISPTMASYLVTRRRTVGKKQGLASLTPTERTIIKLIADYKTTKDIAAILSISPRTVETHRSNICQKLGVRGNHSLMKFALAHQNEL